MKSLKKAEECRIARCDHEKLKMDILEGSLVLQCIMILMVLLFHLNMRLKRRKDDAKRRVGFGHEVGRQNAERAVERRTTFESPNILLSDKLISDSNFLLIPCNS